MGLYMKKFILSIIVLVCFILVNFFKFNINYVMVLIFLFEIIRLLLRKFKQNLDYFIIILFIAIFNALILNFNTAISILLIYDFLDQLLEILNKYIHKYLKNYVKNDYIASFFENGKEVLKKFSTLKKKDILIFRKGEVLTTSGKYNDNYYEIGTLVEEDIFLESDKDYKELIDSKALKEYNILQKTIRKPTLISYIVLLLLSSIIFFILIYYKYELNIALFYSFNFMLIFLPITFFYSKNIPILFSIAYLYKERIKINNIATFFKLNKVDVIVFDKTSVLTDDNISIVNIDNQSDINLVQLIKTLEQNTYDEIGKFFRKQEYDYLFKIDKSKKLNGGIIINFKEDEYYLGNYEFFKHNKIKVKKNKTLGTAIYIVKNNEFLGSVVIRSSINKEVKEIVKYLESINKEVVVLSGDNEDYVRYICNNLDINRYSYNINKKDKLSFLILSKEEDTKVLFIGDYRNDKKLFKEAYLSCSISKKDTDTDTDITIDNNDLTDIKRMFVTYKAFKVSFFLNIFLTILIMLFKLLLLYLGILNLEMSLLITLINMLIIIFVSIEVLMFK
jgi:HAD ATPase, P-type, family IC